MTIGIPPSVRVPAGPVSTMGNVILRGTPPADPQTTKGLTLAWDPLLPTSTLCVRPIMNVLCLFRVYSAEVEKRYARYSAWGLSSSYTALPAEFTSISLEGAE